MGRPTPAEDRPSIVKLGGSVITRKRQAERLRPKLLRSLTEAVAAAPGPVVLLHGAGSFGHPGARRFGLAAAPDPAVNVHERSRGAAIVAVEVRRLHLAVLRALVDAGGLPASLPPASLAANDNGRLAGWSSEPFTEALGRGMTPVTFGDVVPDRGWGHSILSADTIAVRLAADLGARRVVFVSDVPGVYAPGSTGRRPIVPELTAELEDRLAPTGAGPDVTGGIRGKVRAMRAIAEGGVDAVLISGLSDGALSRALKGEAVYGSWARAAVR